MFADKIWLGLSDSQEGRNQECVTRQPLSKKADARDGLASGSSFTWSDLKKEGNSTATVMLRFFI